MISFFDMALYKSINFDYIKYFEGLCKHEVEKIFNKKLYEDVLLSVWKSIQNNQPLETLDQNLVDEFIKEIEEEKTKENYWSGKYS